MNSSARIKDHLERSQAMDVALVIPAVATGFQTIDTVHTVAASFSTEVAAQIPLGTQASLFRKIALGLSPLFLAFGWVAFFKASRQLWQAKKRNFELWMNAGVSFIAASGTTIATIFLLGGLAYVAPYLLVAIFGLNALQGLFYTAKSLGLAYRNKAERWQHLKEAGKHFLGIVTNTLGMVLNIFVFQTAELIAGGIKEFASSIYSIFIHFAELMRFVNGPVTTAILNIRAVGLAWLGAFTLGLISSATKINEESWHMIKGTQPEEATFEREALKDMEQIIKVIGDKNEPFAKRLFLAITAPLTLPLYALTLAVHSVLVRPLAALTVGLPQLLFLSLYHGAKKLFSSKAREPQDGAVVVQGIKEQIPVRSEFKEGNDSVIDLARLRPQSSLDEGSYSPTHFKPAPLVQVGNGNRDSALADEEARSQLKFKCH